MRILVTGGAGFIGSYTVRTLITAGHDVAVLDRDVVGYNVPQYGCNVRDRDVVNYVFRTFLPQAVCHLAAQISVPASFANPTEDAEINIIGGLNVLDCARLYGCKRFVFASSGGAIYGDVPSGLAHETDAPRVASPYGASKLAFENIMFAMMGHGGDMQCHALRYSNVYGVGQRAGVVPAFINAARAGDPLRIFGNCERDYVHVSDVVSANVEALEGRVPWRVMNVATGIGTATEELRQMVRSLTECGGGYTKGPGRTGDVTRSVLSADRLLGIGIKPKSLADGLRETIEGWT